MEAALRLHGAGFIRTDFRIEGDLDFAVARQQKIGEFKLVVGNAGVAGNHQALPGIAARNGPGKVDLLRIGADCGNRRPVDVEPAGGHSGAGQPQLHAAVEIDHFPRRQRSGDQDKDGVDDRFSHDGLLSATNYTRISTGYNRVWEKNRKKPVFIVIF